MNAINVRAGRPVLWLGGLAAFLAAVVIVSASSGPAGIPYDTTVSALLRMIGINAGDVSTTQFRIIEQIRLPRIAVAVFVGAALSMGGAALQALFRNPLADPGLVGVSGGAGLGAIGAIALHWNGGPAGSLGLFAVPGMAFVGALLATGGVTLLANAGGRVSPATLVLAGLAIQSFAGAGIAAIITLTGDAELIRNMLFWLVGGLDSRSWLHVQTALPVVAIGGALLLVLAGDLNILVQGDETAHGLGINVKRTRLGVLVLVSVITAAAVAVSGTIAFVGLIVPNLFRLLVGPDHRLLLPASALGGSIALLSADTIGRIVLQPAELRVGVVTALIGAPFFMFLLWRSRERVGTW